MSLILSGTDGLSDIDGSAATPAIRGTDANTGIFFPAADTIAFAEGGVESMRIDSAGNVGIGTTTASTRLHASGTDTNPVALRLQNTTASTGKTWQITSTNAGSLQLATIVGVADYLTVDSSGNVGIGQTSPVYKLQVNNPVASATADAIVVQNSGVTSLGQVAGIRFRYIGAEPAAIRAVLTDTNNGAGALGFFTSADGQGANLAERMRIDSSGRLLVGTTSVNNGSLSNFYFNSFSNGIETTWAGTNSIYHVLARNGNGFLGGINTNGSTTTYTNLSDYRVKENIEPMQNALSKVSLLKPCTFTYKVDGKDGQGFIAHELQEIFPDAVVGNKDAIDNDGNPVYQAIDTSFLVATLTAAIKEQQALIQSLTTRITALETPVVTPTEPATPSTGTQA